MKNNDGHFYKKEKKQCLKLKAKTPKLNLETQIDKLVYELCGLTEEESGEEEIIKRRVCESKPVF